MYRGEIWWANLPEPVGSEPGYNRPVLVIQDDTFTQSNINTVIVVAEQVIASYSKELLERILHNVTIC